MRRSRRLATLLLLLPMFLNGLWLVCADATPLPDTGAKDTPPGISENCKEICLKIRAAQLGAICILTTDDGYSVAVFSVTVAPPLAAVLLTVSDTSSEFTPAAATVYFNPSLSHSTLPPKA